MKFSKTVLQIDPAREAARLVDQLRQSVRKVMRRYGAVVGISGGVDSAVVLELCVRAFGPGKVRAIFIPERESDPESQRLAQCAATHCGLQPEVVDITGVLEGFRCYERRDAAIRHLFPEYEPQRGYKVKIGLPNNLLEQESYNVFSVTVVAPDGTEATRPLPLQQYLQVVAASNFKQRTRMAVLYYHAELTNFAVVGTANKDEHEQGFFVKYGDGGVDVKPIVHLFKTQVYQLAAYLEVPAEIRERTPTTDTYSAPSSQQEFFFRLPFETLDLLWYAQEHQVPIPEVAQVMGLSEDQVRRAFLDLERKRRTTEYLRMPPLDLTEQSVQRRGLSMIQPGQGAGTRE